jgi:hypothetical protein
MKALRPHKRIRAHALRRLTEVNVALYFSTESRSDHHYGIFLLMEGGEPLLKLFFKEKVERDKIKEELKKVLDELKVNRQKYEGTNPPIMCTTAGAW